MELTEDISIEDSLIIKVQANSVLYAKSYKKYFDKTYKNRIWKQIAEELKQNTEDCKKEWKHLRETFVQKSKALPTGSGAEYNSWPYFDSMMFLKNFVKLRATRCNNIAIIEQEDEDILEGREQSSPGSKSPQTTSSSASDAFQRPPKRKNTIGSTLKAIEDATAAVKKRAQGRDSEDSDALLYKTLISLLNEIPAEKRDKARADLFQTVFQLKRKYVFHLL